MAVDNARRVPHNAVCTGLERPAMSGRLPVVLPSNVVRIRLLARQVQAHLALRPLTRKDAPAMFRYRADPEVARYQMWKERSLEEIEAFIERNAECADLAPRSWYQVGIVESTDALIGDIGIHITEDERQIELGVTLATAWQRRGLATEALTAILDWAFCDVRAHRVFASVDPRNDRSIALMHRLHFRQEAHFRESLYIDGAWVDDMVFAMLQRDWKRRSAKGAKHELDTPHG